MRSHHYKEEGRIKDNKKGNLGKEKREKKEKRKKKKNDKEEEEKSSANPAEKDNEERLFRG